MHVSKKDYENCNATVKETYLIMKILLLEVPLRRKCKKTPFRTEH